ncbi:MAG: single-stranded DNA-binding protein [Chloroflexota bacterium]|nr:single-stranded DNA-binding protein [Chloroflexota bacterium]PLS82248.1 MAG: single-stranded DNA-binding protein [Chloroflexota bacterium]
MAKDLNKVMLIGRLGTDPELRYTQQGVPITTFRMAIGRQWRDGEGNTRDETEWFTIVSWNRLAEICNDHLHKGARVYIEGRLQNRSWDDQQTGEKRFRTEIIASDMIILESRQGGRGEPSDDVGHERNQYGGARSAGGPRGGSRSMPDDQGGFSDEDIPF